jgi:hypothetical protein
MNQRGAVVLAAAVIISVAILIGDALVAYRPLFYWHMSKAPVKTDKLLVQK